MKGGDTSEVDSIVEGLGFPLNFPIIVAMANLSGFPIAESVFFLDGLCRGRVSHPNTSMKPPSYDAHWPPISKAGEQLKLFSTDRADVQGMKISAVAKHFTAGDQRDSGEYPAVIIITAAHTEPRDAGGRVSFRIVVSNEVRDALECIATSRATCVVCEYRVPSTGHHNLLRCVHTPYLTLVETKSASRDISDGGISLSARLDLDSPVNTTAETPQEEVQDSRRAPAAGRVSEHLRATLDAALLTLHRPSLLQRLGYFSLERCVLYCMAPTEHSIVVLWCSQFHGLHSRVDQMREDCQAFAAKASDRSRLSAAKTVRASQGHNRRDVSPQEPQEAVHCPTPLSEQQAIWESFDVLATVTAYGQYGKAPGAVDVPPSLRNRVKSLVIVRNAASIEALPVYEVPTAWQTTAFFTTTTSSTDVKSHGSSPASYGRGGSSAALPIEPSLRSTVSKSAIPLPTTASVSRLDQSAETVDAAVTAVLNWDVQLSHESEPFRPRHHLGEIRRLRRRYEGDGQLSENEIKLISAQESLARQWREIRNRALRGAASQSMKSRRCRSSLSRHALGGSSKILDNPPWNSTTVVVRDPQLTRAVSSTTNRRPRTEDEIDDLLLSGANPIHDYRAMQLHSKPLSGYLVGILVDHGTERSRASQSYIGTASHSDQCKPADFAALASDARAAKQQTRSSATYRHHNVKNHSGDYVAQSASQRMLKAAARLTPRLLHAGNFTDALFASETYGPAIAARQQKLSAAREERKARERGALEQSEMQAQQALSNAVEERQRSVWQTDEKELLRVQEKIRGRTIIDDVTAAVDLAQDLLYHARDRCRGDVGGSAVSHRAPLPIALSLSHGIRKAPLAGVATESMFSVAIPMGLPIALQRETAAILLGAGFFPVEMDRARVMQWQAYHEDVLGFPELTSEDDRDAPLRSTLFRRLLGPGRYDSSAPSNGASSTEASVRFLIDGNDAESTDDVHLVEGLEFYLPRDTIHVARALAIVAQYKEEVASLFTEPSHAHQLQRVQQVRSQLGYTYFDAVALVCRGLTERASVVHADRSFEASVHLSQQQSGGLSRL